MDEDNGLKMLAQKWIDRIESNKCPCYPHQYDLDSISKIDGVACSVKWSVETHGSCPRLRIVFNSVFEVDGNDGSEIGLVSVIEDIHGTTPVVGQKMPIFTVDGMADAIGKLVGRIKTLRYDRMRGITSTPGSSDLERLVFLGDNIGHSGDICCVCHEITTHTTECEHHLCWQCWTKLPKIKGNLHDDGFQQTQSCPICRHEMELYNY